MPIVWRDQLSVGDARIDNDHKQLINLINGFEWATVGDIHLDILDRILNELEQYANEHFAREERTQKGFNYPFHAAHKEAHRHLLRQLLDLRQKFAGLDAQLDDDVRRTVTEMAAFLRNWMVHHILTEDMRMKPYFLGARKALALSSEDDKRAS